MVSAGLFLELTHELTDFLVLFAPNPLDDGTHNLHFPLTICPRERLWSEAILSSIRPLGLNAGGDIENQTSRSGPDQIVFFEQSRDH